MDKTRSTGNPAEAHVNERLSGYLDGELTQQNRQQVSLHLETCRLCAENLESLRELRGRMGQAGLGNTDKEVWREMMDDTTVRFTRGIGWILFLGGLLIIAGIGVFMFISSTSMGVGEKLLASAVYIGLGALFVSVLRQRLIERKTDRYKDVEI
ncbi:MAG: zf-HC2 domain-containing protein [Xanthomonadales bacterium]|nr:zf-HC2 domain-containing protein [Xanthomonadales bacterium]